MLLELNEKQKEIVNILTREYQTIEDLEVKTSISIEVVRSILEYLVVAQYAEKQEESKMAFQISEEGQLYMDKGLPEENLLILFEKGLTSIKQIKDGLKDPNKFNIAILWSKKKKWIKIEEGHVALVEDISIIKEKLKKTKEALRKKGEKVDNPFLNELLQRKLLKEKTGNIKRYKLNSKLKDKQIKKMLKSETKDQLTAEDLKSGSWKNYNYKEYKITEEYNPPRFFGRTNAYIDFLNKVRESLLENGFEEWYSPTIDLEFYNCDVLFMPQDHVARGIHDLYYLDIKSNGKIENSELFKRVSEIHLNGADSGSIGWRYKVSKDISSKLIMRSQTTCTSAHFLEYLSKERPDEDVKMVCIDLNWRPDTRDRTHAFEFKQCEGIITGDNLSIKGLFGALTEICHSIGIKDIKFMPGYFPFTEPSVSGFIKHKALGWIEALPGGIFRPEVTAAFNYKKTVLAYGIGIDRLAMAALGINDIRELYTTNIEQIKNYPIYRG